MYRIIHPVIGLRQVTIPLPDDKLIITNNGAVVNGGIGAVLYIVRENNMQVGRFFSIKLKPHQRKWLPCKIEVLAISSSITHWAPCIIESAHTTQILTDSRPCRHSLRCPVASSLLVLAYPFSCLFLVAMQSPCSISAEMLI